MEGEIKLTKKGNFTAEIIFPEEKPGSWTLFHYIQFFKKKIKKDITHPNFMNYKKLGVLNNQYCFLFEGENTYISLKKHLNKKTLSFKQIIDWGIKIAEVAREAETKKLNWPGLYLNCLRVNSNGDIRIVDPSIVEITKKYCSYMDNIVLEENFKPPEVLKTNEWDQQSRIYSFGVIMYYLITGRQPFTGNIKGYVYEKILTGSSVEPRYIDSKISTKLNDFLLKLIAKDKKERYQTWDQVIKNLKTLKEKQLKITKKKEIQKNYVIGKIMNAYVNSKSYTKCFARWHRKPLIAVSIMVIMIYILSLTFPEEPPVVTIDATPDELVGYFYSGFARRDTGQMKQTTSIDLNRLERMIATAIITEQMELGTRIYNIRNREIKEKRGKPEPVYEISYNFIFNKDGEEITRKMNDIMYLEESNDYWQITEIQGSVKKLIDGELEL